MSKPESYDLIDKHLAGILTPEEVSQLESLIRSSPEWARRYHEAEKMAALLRDAIGKQPAPDEAKRHIRERIATLAFQAPQPSRRLHLPRPRLIAACVLAALAGAYLFVSPAGQPFIPVAYTQEPLPLKDLARSSDVLVLGHTEAVNGHVRFRPVSTVYGETGGRACELPASVKAGRKIALFGRYEGDDLIDVFGGERGIVHLDGLQRWEGRAHPPALVNRLLQRAAHHRTPASALADIDRFLASDASNEGVDPSDGLHYSARVTARYLGRFDVERIRPLLMKLILARDKHPEARTAGAEALVEADPLRTCRSLLMHVLAGPVEMLHAESEDGLVVLHCLHLIQKAGSADLAGDLQVLAKRTHCPGLRRAASAAARAVAGTGARQVSAVGEPAPVRLTVDGREGIVVPACQGKERGLLVVFPGPARVRELSALVNVAIGSGLGVLVLPRNESDVTAWLREAATTKLVTSVETHYLGLGGGGADAVSAARAVPPARLVLLKPAPALLRRLPADVSVDVFSSGRDLSVDWGPTLRQHGLHPADLPELLAKPTLLSELVSAD